MPAERYAAWTRPEQSQPWGPLPPQTYGSPRWLLAKAMAPSVPCRTGVPEEPEEPEELDEPEEDPDPEPPAKRSYLSLWLV